MLHVEPCSDSQWLSPFLSKFVETVSSAYPMRDRGLNGFTSVVSLWVDYLSVCLSVCCQFKCGVPRLTYMFVLRRRYRRLHVSVYSVYSSCLSKYDNSELVNDKLNMV